MDDVFLAGEDLGGFVDQGFDVVAECHE